MWRHLGNSFASNSLDESSWMKRVAWLLSACLTSSLAMPSRAVENPYAYVVGASAVNICLVRFGYLTTDQAVELLFDGTTNATALLLSGNGHIDLRPSGNEIPNNAVTPTGDVLLSTKNFALGDNYTIIIEFR